MVYHVCAVNGSVAYTVAARARNNMAVEALLLDFLVLLAGPGGLLAVLD